MKYVALLRGINAGGRRRVPMAELRQIFSEMGFCEVSTYINSGNVIFSADTLPDVMAIQKTLEEHFGFEIDTLVLSAPEVVAVASVIPNDWKNDYTDDKSDVAYLFDDVNSPDILGKTGCRSEVETLIYTNHAVLSSVSRKNQSKCSMLKLVGTSLYRRMTIRNVTTARKLAELIGG